MCALSLLLSSNNLTRYNLNFEQLGYKNYNEILNAKDWNTTKPRANIYGFNFRRLLLIPSQNRLNFELRLKDLLEDEVDEKYYLSSKALSGLINTTFQSSKLESRTEDENGVIPTLLARDYKDPKLVQVAQLDGFESSGRIYDEDGLCPTINTMGGGQREPKVAITTNESQMPFVAELRTDEGIRTFKDGLVGTLRTTESCGDKIVIEESIAT